MKALLDRLPGNGYKTAVGLAVMALALLAAYLKVLGQEMVQGAFLAGLTLATAGAVHKVVKRRRRTRRRNGGAE